MAMNATHEQRNSHRVDAALGWDSSWTCSTFHADIHETDLALQLQKALLDQQAVPSSLIDRLVSTIQALPFPLHPMNHTDRLALDKSGTTLWNITTKNQWGGNTSQSLTVHCQSKTRRTISSLRN